MIEIIKVLNSSVVLVNYNGQEMVALGKGIGFGKRPGEEVLTSAIDKMFYSVDDENISTYIQYAESIESIYFEVTQETIDYAEKLLQVKLSNGVYFTLADHLQFAIERFQKDVRLNNRVLWEIKLYYPQEFQVGQFMVERVGDVFDLNLPEEEAANIAFHIINARQEHEAQLDTVKSAKMINNIVNIVKYSAGLDEADNPLHFQRFITHVKYFVERILTNRMLFGKDDVLFNHIYDQYGEAVDVANKIKMHILTFQEVAISDEELMYLIIHIDRLLKGKKSQ